MPTVPNPTRPGALRPIELITDRAKRYRAHRNPPPGPRLCAACGSRKNIDLDHIDGNEGNDAPENKQWLCRSCNATKGQHFARNGQGKRTRQYNPTKGLGIQTAAQYGLVQKVLRGMAEGDLKQAIQLMHDTPAEDRSEFTRELWIYRKKMYGRSGRTTEPTPKRPKPRKRYTQRELAEVPF